MKNKLQFSILIATFSLILGMSNVVNAQAPNLGSASDFVLFTTVGAVTNTGISHVTGNVGSNNGAVTGFGNVNGVMTYTGNQKSAQCEADLLVAYGQLNATIPTFFPSSTLGGDTLIPGIYSITGASTLNGTLVLNANEDPNAVFIFKIFGPFSTTANSQIKLINGALACNVYWQVEGLVSMASGTQMKGTLIVHNSAINMNTGVNLEGRALAISGAVSVDGVLTFTPIGCGSPILTGPTAPNLSSVECYAIFSSNGPVANAGISFVTGDVGTNVGLTTGFNPLNVTGDIHPIPDGSTTAAASDLLNAYTYLNALPHDIELLYPAQFGNSLVLTPHTYLMNAAVSLTDTVFLNGMGDSNAVFIMKTYGAFSTSTYSQVVLTNGTKAENVYWLVNGMVTINDYSTFNGTIVTNNGAINLNTGATINGRILTTNGAVATAAVTAIMPPGCFAALAAVITTEPIDITACEGSSAAFSVVATGTGLTYQWRKGDVNLVNGVNITGATSDTLRINPVNLSDTASNYNVIVVSLSGNDTSEYVTLTVHPETLITLEPINIITSEGDSIAFSVTAVGAGLNYQWRKGNTILTNGVSISGANTATLIINPVSMLDTSNNYNVIVSGLCGNDTSMNVMLTVNAVTLIIVEPTNKTVCEGSSAEFSVVATGTALTYQWRKGNVNLVNGVNITGATSDTLRIDPVNLSDTASNYNVIVTGVSGTDTSMNVSLTVTPATLITLEPINKVTTLGSLTEFSVTAVGTGLRYQWRKGNTNILNSVSISGATTATLTIDPVSVLDTANNYNVIVTGFCGVDTSMNVSLTLSLIVDSSAVIVVQPENKIICLGGSVFFTVSATGANLTYQWRKGEVNLIDGGNISGANTDTLWINPVLITDTASNYNVVITGGTSGTSGSSGPSTVTLNSAGDYGILSGVGISSTGFSVITDLNIGISPGFRSQIVGFPPATVVNGSIFASDDVAPPGVGAMLAQAKLDLTNAYLFAEGATAPAPVTVAGDQGGLTLAPGIYKSTSTLLIQSGDLTLDAQGDPNATWIFQIASDFTTIGGAGGNVILAGGAQAKNVIWQVGSSATIGNYTSFKGTILALTSITMNTGSTIDGRLLARNGAVVLSGTNLINKPANTISTDTNIVSVYFSLTVNPPTIITVEPINVTVCVGSSATFSVTATGSNLTYQWRKGNVNLINTGNITGATSATLTINPVSALDAANNYNVIVSGLCGNDTSLNVSLIVNPATLITVEPINKIASVGSTVEYTVTATGAGLTYQWRKGTVNLINNSNISGATSDTLTISPVGLLDAATNYNVIVSGICGNDTSIYVSLNVNALTVIVLEPTNDTTCIGSSVDFTVTATGASLTYQWRKGNVNLINNGNISGATSATLTINPVTLIDGALNYNVIVSGLSGNDTSMNVSLTVNPATLITVEPIYATVCAGSSATFNVTATGSNLTYQWRKGTVNLINTGNITGATSATLTINPVSATDEALNYNVIVTGLCGNDTSSFATLTVNPATLITVEPINATVCAGSTATFNVTATGSNLTYQWRKGTVNLINTGNITGATSATLTINPVSATDAATNYNVIVTGLCGNDTSSFATLTVNPATLITVDPIYATVCAGSTATYNVTATGSNLTYQWRKGTVNLINIGNITGATSATLTINPVSATDAATIYNVIVTGLCGNDTSSFATLTVNPATLITVEPINATVCAGSSTTFNVTATGSNLTYQWRKGTANLINTGNITGATSATLTIDPVSATDAATNYSVIVSGLCGNDTSVYFSLTVNPATLITAEPINVTVCAGSSATFNVTATGNTLTYQWRKGTVNLTNTGNITGANTATLTIDPVSATDAATNYNVIVTGLCGNDTSDYVTLTVHTVPIANASSNSPVCEGSDIELSATTVTGATYAWTSTTGFTSALQNPTITNATLSDGGTYTLVVSANSCNSLPSSTIVAVDICYANLSVIKTASNVNPLVGTTITFTIVVTNNGPTDATGVWVNEVLESGYQYVSSTVTVGDYDPITGVWTIGSLANGSSATMTITVTVIANGTYINTVTVDGNEPDAILPDNTSTVETTPIDFYIPEGFSPNGDGINDLFVIRGILYYPNNTFAVFNRWGEKVFEANPYQSTWSGNCTTGISIGGDLLPTGTYFYVLDLNNGREPFKGTIYLIR